MNDKDKDAGFHLAGWALFLLCAIVFLYAAVRDGDVILILASLLFLGGCIAFLIPLLFPAASIRQVGSREKDGSRAEKR